MGKKPKAKKLSKKAALRKVDPSYLPTPPPPPEEELGSTVILDKPSAAGSIYKVLGKDGYDDGGIGDLTMVLDLEDCVLRRKRGEAAYLAASKADLLPRVKTGDFARLNRRDQKVHLANLLFQDENEEESGEIFMERRVEDDTDKEKAEKKNKLNQAKYALRASIVLREPSALCLCLNEISSRYLAYRGKDGAADALRCVEKCLEIASDGYYDSDEIAIEANEEPKLDPKYEKNATYPGLMNPASLKYQSSRVAELVLRSTYVQQGNALSALGRHEEARQAYEKILPMMKNEHRCGRVDWEVSSILINIGNTYSREGNLQKALEFYAKSEQLGKDHIEDEDGNKKDGTGIVFVSKRAESFALNKAGKIDEAKAMMRTVLELKKRHEEEIEKDRKRREEMSIEEMKENAAENVLAEEKAT